MNVIIFAEHCNLNLETTIESIPAQVAAVHDVVHVHVLGAVQEPPFKQAFVQIAATKNQQFRTYTKKVIIFLDRSS